MNKEVTQYEETHLLGAPRKEEMWGKGPWCDEPDQVTFKYRDFECKCLRITRISPSGHSFGGHWCGYVKLKDDKYIQKDPYALPFTVHGGITYGREEPTGYWIGFDCGHFRDLVPSMDNLLKRTEFYKKSGFTPDFLRSDFSYQAYRKVSFVVGECQRLVDEIIDGPEASQE